MVAALRANLQKIEQASRYGPSRMAESAYRLPATAICELL
jgi:hypothetical protein